MIRTQVKLEYGITDFSCPNHFAYFVDDLWWGLTCDMQIYTSVHQSIHTPLRPLLCQSFFFGLWVSDYFWPLWPWITVLSIQRGHKQVLGAYVHIPVFPFLLTKYLEVKFLGHRISVWFNSVKIYSNVCKGTITICALTSQMWELHANACFPSSFSL